MWVAGYEPKAVSWSLQIDRAMEGSRFDVRSGGGWLSNMETWLLE